MNRNEIINAQNMQNHCQHNLYICHCTPSSQDPSPIHPPLPPKLKSAMKQKSNYHNTLPPPRNNKNKMVPMSPNRHQSISMQRYEDQTLLVPHNSNQPIHIIHQQTLPRMIGVRHQNNGTQFQQSSPGLHLRQQQQHNLLETHSPISDNKQHVSNNLVTSVTTESCNGNLSSNERSPSTDSSSSSVSAPTQIMATLPRGFASNQENGNNHLSEGTVNPLSLIADPSSLDITGNHLETSNSVTAVPFITTGTGVTITSSLSSAGLSSTTTPNIRDLDRMNQHYDQIIQRQAIVNQINNRKFFTCEFFHGRTCIERIIFGFLIVLILSVFLIGGLIFVQVLSGASGLQSISEIIFPRNSPRNDPSRISQPSQLRPDNDIGRLLSDEDIEIVRIKTTEEHKIKGSLKSESIVRTKRVCVTKECSDLSRRILQSVNPEADPCNSFYSFACGGWMARNQPPPRRMVHSVMSQMRDEVDLKLKSLIDGINKNRSDKVNVKLRQFYDSCMDVDAIRTKGFIPAVDFLHKNFSFFLQKPTFESSTYHRSSSSTFYDPSSPSLNSIIEGENESPTQELTSLLLKLLKVNGTPLIDISLDLSPRNSSMYIGVIRVPQRAALLPRLVRPRKDLSFINRWVQKRRKRNSGRQNYKVVPRKEIFRSFQNALNSQRVAALVKTAETMGILDTYSDGAKQADIDEILGFLASLEKIIPSEKQLKKSLMNNAIYNEYTVDELQASFGYLNWHGLLAALFPKPPSPQETFLVHDPLYLRKLGRILSLYEKRVVWKSLLVLYAKDVLTDLVTIHHGQPRWQYCTQVSAMLFGEALSRLFLSSTAPNDRRKISDEVETIFRLMKQNIISKISKTKWMSNDETRSESIEKIEKLHGSLLGSNIFFNYTFLEHRYDGISMGTDYFTNVMTMFAHFRMNLYHFINAPVDRTTYTWNLISFPFTVNAFHLQQLNSIVIPLGLVRDTHFSLRVPKYLNVGSLGLTLAHEILHSLDTTGRQFDHRGRLTSDFWDSESRKNFANVSQCVVKQYREHFKRPLRIDARSITLEIDGEFTLNENICDIDGMNTAASAFEELYESAATMVPTGDLVYLPNNPYTPQQLFFLNTAQAYCSHVGPVSYVLYLELDEHSPNPERVDGFMMNTRSFNEAFECPVGSRMNPQKKCGIWSN